ncbi:hypothetical protein HOY34_05145 [Xinfangfangia sp. D13-10-4-6]|uniref:hypothetical protein n=1 Tax=Pseudogemmobacter hezensis TaxID=2737662 RepID=UPI00155542AB|nr:hypothetical protein [Pseudogemmobacter hezensis]NPD14587.1 hypothetical protein [Pseudogemmobacter hezensis]
MSLADPGFKNFAGRVRRIEKAHRKGYGFEARGTLGRSATWRRQRSFGKLVRSFLFMVLLGWVMKGAIFFYVGESVYEERVAGMAMGNNFDPIAAGIMTSDPVTRLIAAFLGEVFPQVHGQSGL